MLLEQNPEINLFYKTEINIGGIKYKWWIISHITNPLSNPLEQWLIVLDNQWVTFLTYDFEYAKGKFVLNSQCV